MKREERHYSIAELALMTRLSTKTIRNYLKMGLLKGEKQMVHGGFPRMKLVNFSGAVRKGCIGNKEKWTSIRFFEWNASKK